MTRDLTTFGLLQIAGADAAKFLQGQLTCDLQKITPGKMTLAAHCNPQGRVLSLFYLLNHAESYYLLLPQKMVAVATAALKKYALFYKVTLSEITERTAEIDELILVCQHHFLNEDVPMIYPETSGEFLPHELNLPSLNAVDFNKGCYTGQEIIARMHYRGKVKNRLYRYQLATPTCPPPGEEVYSTVDHRICGTVVNAWQENQVCHAFIIMHENNKDDASITFKNHVPVYISKTSEE